MAVYVLDPKVDNRDHPYWQGSSYCGRCYVSAPSESTARAIAADAFAVTIEKSSQTSTSSISPWLRADFVELRLMDTPFNKQEVGDVLLPSGEVIRRRVSMSRTGNES